MKRGLFLFFLVLLSISYISAIDTQIRVKSYPNHEVSLSFVDPQSLEIIESMRQETGDSGEFSVTFSTDLSDFNLVTFVKRPGEDIVLSKGFNDLVPGENLYLTLIQGNIKIEQDEGQGVIVAQNDSETVENDSEIVIAQEEETVIEKPSNTTPSSALTGAATSKDTGSSSNSTYYIFGAIVLVFVFLGTLMLRRRPSYSEPQIQEVKVRKFSEFQKERQDLQKEMRNAAATGQPSEQSSDYKKSIEAAEKKIEEAQREIQKLKNEEKIKDAKKRLIDDERELMRLRRGE